MPEGPEATRRPGLRKLAPELVARASDQTAAAINRIMLTFLGVAVFCLLSLLTPDAALLTGGERLNVPFAGPVSFRGLIVLGPALLIVLRIYLQIYAEHWRRLELIRSRLPAPPWVPTLAPLQNPLLRAFVGFVFYLLLPLTMFAFTWKAAVLPAWGSGLLSVAVAVVVGHLMLPLRRSWKLKAFLGGSAAIVVAALVISGELLVSRPANLFRADLSNQWLPGSYLRDANLSYANLDRTDLRSADLSGANLVGARLAGAYLDDARLRDADLRNANLRAASLVGAVLEGAVLSGGRMYAVGDRPPRGADLEGANLRQAHLAGAALALTNLSKADLSWAHLEGADLQSANLESANLSYSFSAGANLHDANLVKADLRGARLMGAVLANANLIGAKLVGSELADADLSGANLKNADLARANLIDADFMSAQNLTQSQLDEACGDETTKLAPGLKAGTNCRTAPTDTPW